MRYVAIGLLVATLIIAPPIQASSTVTVALAINATATFPFNEPAFEASCEIEVAGGADAGDVLDAAAAEGCIAAWTSTTHPTFGRFLTGVTKTGTSISTDARNVDTTRFLCGTFPPNPGGSILYASWFFGVNLLGSDTGIDGYSAAEDDRLEFHYVVDTCTFGLGLPAALAGRGPYSPVPLAGNPTTDPGTAEVL